MPNTNNQLSQKINRLKLENRSFKHERDLLIYQSKHGHGVNLNCSVKKSAGNTINCIELSWHIGTNAKGRLFPILCWKLNEQFITS